MDAVLPLAAFDVERARLLRRSLERFYGDMGTCWVVTPDKDRAAIEAEFPGDRYRVVPESDVVPEVRLRLAYNHLRWPGCRGGVRLLGWYLAQLIVLGISDRVTTDFYLVLDADVMCVRPTRDVDLLPGGRALMTELAEDDNADWYEWAERVLGMPRSGRVYGVAPGVLSTAGVLALRDHLETRVNDSLKRIARVVPRAVAGRAEIDGWRGYLIRNLPWTEFALYGTFLEAVGTYERYHAPGGPETVYGNCVWDREDFDSWDAAKSFDSPDFFFTVVQSSTQVPVADIERRVAPYLS